MATSIDLARRLLGAAVNDELMARSVLPVEGVTDAGLGNLCQQAVEKAIKAILAAQGTEIPLHPQHRKAQRLRRGIRDRTAHRRRAGGQGTVVEALVLLAS